MKILEVTDVSISFGGVRALDRVTFDVEKGELLALIGPNGAGKTTMFNVVSGMFHADEGEVVFKGRKITRLPAQVISHLGVSRSFQANILFHSFTVMDNLLIALYNRHRRWASLLSSGRGLRGREMAEEAKEIMDFFQLMPYKDQLPSAIPHQQQRILGIAIALAARPELMLLDEPLTGLNPEECGTIIDFAKRLQERGITIIIVEHNMREVMKYCPRIVVLNEGRKIAEGPPEIISKDELTTRAYLGEGFALPT